MEQSGSIHSFSLKFMWKVFFKSGYFWSAAFLVAFGLYNLSSVWIIADERGFLSGLVPEELGIFTLLFLGAGLWFCADLYQIYEEASHTTNEARQKLLAESAYRTTRMFYVAAALSIFALLLCRMLIAHV